MNYVNNHIRHDHINKIIALKDKTNITNYCNNLYGKLIIRIPFFQIINMASKL